MPPPHCPMCVYHKRQADEAMADYVALKAHSESQLAQLHDLQRTLEAEMHAMHATIETLGATNLSLIERLAVRSDDLVQPKTRVHVTIPRSASPPRPPNAQIALLRAQVAQYKAEVHRLGVLWTKATMQTDKLAKQLLLLQRSNDAAQKRLLSDQKGLMVRLDATTNELHSTREKVTSLQAHVHALERTLVQISPQREL
ncbi:hypothetical protein SPRG_01862 [Saprolegnia parasitica CBS 223.65]|uniref:Uncharacterized protein n=1 Tax=Saprolegnia parasitica (strain CBS 223.65) TaxID=695850 RepID=A0A067D1Z7_SAPPC|nr:hypothetical protein SPRG_01862 [Saprolegnia parasitica CBS 223.65]KDO33047.1 hypothetical protein SPRG_01862 [Saprolegnia parasitica CBS 223.65]|eukprot:XP_012195818.1 hypothetical protein SPRG_01862 [Saprolegnia parasitica CBS 223.65]